MLSSHTSKLDCLNSLHTKVLHAEMDSLVSLMQPANLVMLRCFIQLEPSSVRPSLHPTSPVIMALQDADSDVPSQGHGLSQSKASGMSKGRTGQPVSSRGMSTRQSKRTAVQEIKTSGEAQVNNVHCCKL